jgi:hypothetical protein
MFTLGSRHAGQRRIAPGDNPKLAEAEYFLGLMEKDWSSPAFQYNLSAFLSALISCVEHNRLFSKDPRFTQWYREAVKTYVNRQEIVDLREFRRKEVHLNGTPAWQEVTLLFPQDRPIRHGESWTINLSAPASEEESSEIFEAVGESEVRRRWVWSAPDSPDVLELCRKGLASVQEMLDSYCMMRFRD